MPVRIQSPPSIEEELICSETVRLICHPAGPSGHIVERDDSRRSKAQEDGEDNIARTDASEIGYSKDEIEVRNQQTKRMQLLCFDRPIPCNLGIPIIGQKADIDWQIIPDSGLILCGS